jgi:hypothetical protein
MNEFWHRTGLSREYYIASLPPGYRTLNPLSAGTESRNWQPSSAAEANGCTDKES